MANGLLGPEGYDPALVGLASGILQGGQASRLPVFLGPALGQGLLQSHTLEQAAKRADLDAQFINAQVRHLGTQDMSTLLKAMQAQQAAQAMGQWAGGNIPYLPSPAPSGDAQLTLPAAGGGQGVFRTGTPQAAAAPGVRVPNFAWLAQNYVAPEQIAKLIEQWKLENPDLQISASGIITHPRTGQVLGSIPFGSATGDIGQIQMGPQGNTFVPASGNLQYQQAREQARRAGSAPFEDPVRVIGPGGQTISVPRPAYAAPWLTQGQQPSSAMPGGAPMQPGASGQAAQGAQGYRGAISGPGAQEQQELEERGKTLAKAEGTTNSDAAMAAVSNRYLDNMELYAKNFTPGKLADMQSNLIQWGQAMGFPVPREARDAAGSIQALSSLAIKMAGDTTRQADAQPSQLQYFKILESMPSSARTPEGFRQIVAYLRDVNNMRIAKASALQQYRATHNGSTDGFQSQWDKQVGQLPLVWNQQAAAGAAVRGAGGYTQEQLLGEMLRRNPQLLQQLTNQRGQQPQR